MSVECGPPLADYAGSALRHESTYDGVPISHPFWCDPGKCDAGGFNLDHHSAMVVHKPELDDRLVKVALGRLDEVFRGDHRIGQYSVRLSTTYGAGECGADGDEPEVFLSAADARAVAEQLLAHAARLDALAAGTSTTSSTPHQAG